MSDGQGWGRELYEAAREDSLNEAFAAIARIAHAAGMFKVAATQANSISEAGEIIAQEVERLRALHQAVTLAAQAAAEPGSQEEPLLDAAAELVIGKGPWTVTYQLTDQNGRVICGSQVGPLRHAGDQAVIRFGPSDVRVML